MIDQNSLSGASFRPRFAGKSPALSLFLTSDEAVPRVVTVIHEEAEWMPCELC